MKIKFTLFLMLFACIIANAQLTSLLLDSAKVEGGPANYPLSTPAGWQNDPAALVDDPFAYDPNNPTSAYPAQGWTTVPPFSYYFMKGEFEPERDWTYPDFPKAGVDSNWMSIDITIPPGKRMKYLDCWGQTHDLPSSPQSQDLVIIIKDANARWYYVNWDGIPRGDTPEKAYGRFDLAAAGITDNLQKSATQIAFVRTNRGKEQFIRIIELRIALEDDPGVGDNTAPVLSGLPAGDFPAKSDVEGTSNEEGTIYLVPDATYNNLAEVQAAQVAKVACKANEMFAVNTENLALATYKIIALDPGGNITEAASTITLIVDVAGPVLTSVKTGTMPITSWITFTSNEKGHAYLVPEGTTADSASITNAAVQQISMKKGMNALQTYEVSVANYVVFALDLLGNISTVSDVIALKSLAVETKLVEAPITNATLLSPKYNDKYNLGIYATNDPFDYNPNLPTLTAPHQAWDGTKLTTHCYSEAPWNDIGWQCNFSIPAAPAGLSLYALDLWGRVWFDLPGGDYSTEAWGERTRNLELYLWNSDSTIFWETYGAWVGVPYPADGAYARFVFRTADVPEDILKNGGGLLIKTKEGTDTYLHIDELRIVAAPEANERPVANAGPAQTVAPGATVTLDGSASTDLDGDALTYLWESITDPNIVLSSDTAKMPTFTAPTTNGVYRFTLIVNDGKIASAKALVTITVGTSAVNAVSYNMLNVYPNPSDDRFFVDLTSMNSESMITVFSLNGTTLFKDLAKEGAVYELNASLEPGTYVLRVQNDDAILTHKLLVK